MIYNERYADFLKFAIQRIIESAHLYESEAKKCKNTYTRLYLYYLAGKKRVQHVILEMIAAENRTDQQLQSLECRIGGTDNFPHSLACHSPEEILRFAQERAEKDLNLYISLSALEEDAPTKKLLTTLGRFTREFIKDINDGYTRFAFKKYSRDIKPKVIAPKPVYEEALTK